MNSSLRYLLFMDMNTVRLTVSLMLVVSASTAQKHPSGVKIEASSSTGAFSLNSASLSTYGNSFSQNGFKYFAISPYTTIYRKGCSDDPDQVCVSSRRYFAYGREHHKYNSGDDFGWDICRESVMIEPSKWYVEREGAVEPVDENDKKYEKYLRGPYTALDKETDEVERKTDKVERKTDKVERKTDKVERKTDRVERVKREARPVERMEENYVYWDCDDGEWCQYEGLTCAVPWYNSIYLVKHIVKWFESETKENSSGILLTICIVREEPDPDVILPLYVPPISVKQYNDDDEQDPRLPPSYAQAVQT